MRSVCGADITVISSGSNMVYVSNITGVTIDGFGITGGTIGVYINLATATVTNSKIYGNSNGGGAGGGVYLTNAGSTLTISNSEIYNNSATSGGGVFYNGGTNHVISNSIIRDNTSTAGGGGGIFPQSCSLTVTDSVIKDNNAATYGGAAYLNGADVDYIRTTITGNTATTLGGAMYLSNSSASADFENCIVADNQGTQGGMIYTNAGSATIINSTIADNRATAGSGGAFRTSTTSTVTVRNSILWGNLASTTGHVAYFNGGTLNISDSIIANGGDGIYTDAPYMEGTITLNISGYTSEHDPLFVNASGGDYHIQASSDAIDNASATYAPANDIDGDSRPQGSADDIGADEYDGTISNSPVLSWTGEATYESDGVNPDSAVGGSSFEFRINYTDADNNAPTSIQVWVDRNDNGTYESSEKYDMTAVNVDNTYSDGKLYSKTLTLLYAGNGAFNYRFYASDGTVDAAGAPTSDNTVTITNSTPALSWTGETNYSDDGVNPDSGLSGSDFEFRVDYTDTDNTAPSYIEVWVDEDDSGMYDLDEKYGMTETDGDDTNYTDGKRYSKTLTIASAGDGILNYKFAASDGTDSTTGAPTGDSSINVSGVTVSFTSASQATIDESGTSTITAQLSAVSGQDVTVPFTINGSSTATGGGTDYSITASPIVIIAGNTTADITVTISVDSLDEDGETVIVDMGTPTNAVQGAITSHTVTITDDDATPTVTFTSASQAMADESGTATITAQLSAASGRDVTVPFTVNVSSTATGSGTDYSITASPIVIIAGNTTADITATIAADSLDENNETVIVDMGTPTNATQGATTTHTVTITDDDPTPTVTFTSASQATINESGTATITAQLSAISGRDVTVPFTVNGSSTATGGGTDYSITASLITMTAGNTTADITVTITDDSLNEDDETVIVDMGTPTNATQGAITTHTVTITDDDLGGGTIYTVCKAGHADEPCDYQSINAGIDDAAVVAGDTLLVSADTYSENINFDGKNITIQSKAGAASTKIQGDGSANAVVSFLSGESVAAILDGFTIDNQRATGADGRGVKITNSATPTIKNCIIEGNLLTTISSGDSYWGAGIYINGGGATIDNTIIGQSGTGNTANHGAGIYATNGLDINISNSTISYNSGRDYAGIYLVSMTGATMLTNTNVIYNSATTGYTTGGIYAGASSVSISGGSISNNTGRAGSGLRIDNSPTVTSITNVTIDNNIGGPIAGGAVYSTSSPLTITGGSISGNTGSRDGGAIYLTGNYSGFPAGTRTTVSGTTIDGNSSSGYSGGGIYSNTIPITINGNAVISNNTAGAGGGAYLLNLTDTAIFDYVTISGNTGGGTYNGGGIYSTGSPMTISNSTITGNSVPRLGGGIYITGSYATTNTITDSTISNNSSTSNYSGGGIYTDRPLQIDGSTISGNDSGSGGGIYSTNALTINDSTISGNFGNGTATTDGGGLYLNGTNTIERSAISGNIARNGGGMYVAGGTTTVRNSNITGNVANIDGGGSMVTGATTLNIYNSTVAGNYAGSTGNGGGGLRNNAATLNIENGIVYDNTATSASKAGISTSGTTNINYSSYEVISGTCTSCANNRPMGEDPLFDTLAQAGPGTPTPAGNFHILTGSPVIDQGTNNGYTPDIDGDARPLGGGYDMGADEKE